MHEIQAFYDAITARAEEAIAFCDKFSLDDTARGCAQSDAPSLFDDSGVVSGRVLEAAEGARHGRDHAGLRVRTGAVTVLTVLRAARWADVEAGEVRSPAVVVIDGNRISGGQSR